MPDRYEILEEIGRGRFATVYRARDIKLDRPVALKELNPYLLADADGIQRFRREARLIARLNHPRIVTIHDISQAAGRHFLVMELIHGSNLAQLLAQRGRLPWPEALSIIAAVAEGLAYAHNHHILHRDLKPANILLDPQRGPLLSDFGLAKLVSNNSLSRSGTMRGTPHYLAPELWEGQAATPQADIYALACILFELVTGEKLFSGQTPPAVMLAHFQPLALPDTWPEATPPQLGDALRVALARQPAARYRDVGQMIEAFQSLPMPEAAVSPSPISATDGGAPPGSPRLQVNLLGDFCLWYDGQLLTGLNQARQQSLLAYLVLNARAPQSRQHLSFLFWPDSTEGQARTNLRYLLYQLRRAFPAIEQYLEINTQTLHWSRSEAVNLDVTTFEHLASAAVQVTDPSRQRHMLEQAIELYRGELLPSCYDEWIMPYREQFNQKYIETLERLIDLLEAGGDYRPAIQYATRLLNHDRVHEAAYRRLMRLHTLCGERASALRVYHTCVSALKQELGVEPGPDTQAIYQRILNNPPPATRPDPLSPTPPVPAATLKLVGREQEWQQLQTAWRAVLRGPPGLVLIAGEAGIGKTRLAEEMLLWAGQRAIPTSRTRSYAAEGRLAYAPVAGWLRSETYRPKLLQLDDVWLTELARLLPEILTERPDLPHPQPLHDSWQRQRFFEALAHAILLPQEPLLLQIDDLQWCDREALEWLHFLLHFDLTAPLLLLGTVRIEEVDSGHPLNELVNHLRSGGQLTEIELEPLDEAATATLAGQAANRELTQSEQNFIFDQTEGNPFFVVETVRAGLSQALPFPPPLNPGPAAAEATSLLSVQAAGLPPKVRAVIQARLAQLSPPARELAGLAAVVGRSFTYEVLIKASSLSEDEVVRSLDELWQRRIVREQGASEYDFSHDRLREVTYVEIGLAQRRLLHRRVAQALEGLLAPNLDEISAQLAAHYEYSGQIEQAISYYQRAGEMAQRIYANTEAVKYLERSLALLAQLLPSPERDRQELELLSLLGVSWVALKGYSAKVVIDTYNRAYRLCRRLGDVPNGPVLRALAIFCVTTQEFEAAIDYGRQLLAQAEQQQDALLETEAHYVLGVAYFWQGDFILAKEELEQGLATYKAEHQEAHLRLYSQDPSVICQCRLAAILWFLGYPDQALEASRQALISSQKISHPLSLGYVLHWAAMLNHFARDIEATRTVAQIGLKLSQNQQLSFWLGLCHFLEGWAQVERGVSKAGFVKMGEGFSTFTNIGATFLLPYLMALWAEQEAKLGQFEAALARIDEALESVKRHKEEWCLAELTRLKAEILLRQGAEVVEVEQGYQAAITIARRQQAKSLELRATLNLCRLWQQQGKTDQARHTLNAIYSWFTEGFDTPDLQEARRMLAEELAIK